jgi:hypothetical protein
MRKCVAKTHAPNSLWWHQLGMHAKYSALNCGPPSALICSSSLCISHRTHSCENKCQPAVSQTCSCQGTNRAHRQQLQRHWRSLQCQAGPSDFDTSKSKVWYHIGLQQLLQNQRLGSLPSLAGSSVFQSWTRCPPLSRAACCGLLSCSMTWTSICARHLNLPTLSMS